MRLTSKDTVGLALVAGTFTAVLLHASGEHREAHLSPVVDAGGATTSAETAPTFAFVDFNVVPTGGQEVLRRQVVLIRNGLVSGIGPVGAVEPPAGSIRVEGDGSAFLVPGLVDAHAHLPDAREDFLPLFIANGVTTIFNLEGDGRHLELRDRSRDPDFVGPTIFTSGAFVHDGLVPSPEAARREVEAQAAAGYDFVKVHGRLSAPTYAALMEAAMDVGIPVVGHAPRNLPFSAVLEGSQAGIVHAEDLIYTALQDLDSAQAQPIAAAMAAAGTWLTPTLSTFDNITGQWASPEGLASRLAETESQYLPSALRRTWSTSDLYVGRPEHERARIEEMDAFHGPLIRTMDRAGVRMLTGTDTPLPGMVPGFSLHDELDALEAIGMRAADVFAAATSNAGRFARENIDDTSLFGTIEIGARADIVLVARDPREDLRTLRRPLGVMVRGTWYTQAQLQRMLSLVSGVPIADD